MSDICGTSDVRSIAAINVALPRHITIRHPQRSHRLVVIGAAMYVIPIANEPIHAVEKKILVIDLYKEPFIKLANWSTKERMISIQSSFLAV